MSDGDRTLGELASEFARRANEICGMTPEMVQQATQPDTAIMFTKDRMGNVLSAVKVVNLLPE